MKRIRKWTLMLGLAGPAVALPSCSSEVGRELRDAALTGLSSFVQQAVVEILDAGLNPVLDEA
jgi:hypothetical protein